ncbi:MAG TPA: 50S ribosomal protein L4 [Syntrophales bacterium]|nr:50S ribosomal protein L4 [Syntrophales bacterium]HOH72136.1 50S ribosomal protein L4 [Syntrophales bacterium]HPN07691.1 50S ribosomal protein L4 [Syntrophales bacterium]HPX80737.1 50S ribosomal protein L4 [Syntrophales bacterium]HQB12995.1 50S ribosomal protein L4 [Syntrophales bacterium]
MPVAAVYDIENNKVAEIELSDQVFGATVNEAAMYEVVRMQLVTRRLGTAATKTRRDISGGGKKPWRQKGTGRARAGTTRSPIWRGGGTVFGPHPRDYAFKVPRKVRKLALVSALSQKFKEERMIILSDFPLAEVKTKKFKEVVDRFGWKKALVVIDKSNPILEKSSRNLQEIKMIRSEGINVYDLLNHEHVVLLAPSVKNIEGALRS